MIYLVLAVISSSLVSIVMRLSTDRVKNNMGMLAVNYATALSLSMLTGGAGAFDFNAPGFGGAALLGAVNGVLYMTSLVAFQSGVAKIGVVLPSVFMKLGILVPMVVSVVFFGERPGALQITGFVVAVFAILLINSGGEKRKGSFDMGLILLLLLSGGAEGMIKVFEQLSTAYFTGTFFSFTFIVAVSLCLVMLVKKGQKIGKNELLFGALVGIPNFLSAKFLLPALERMPAVIVYPTNSVSIILVVTLVGVAVFGERLRKQQWVAMLLILAALALLNM